MSDFCLYWLLVELQIDSNSALQCMCLKIVVVNNCNADLMDCFFVLFCFFFFYYLQDAFSGCQILPCSHKAHRECANVAVTQNVM